MKQLIQIILSLTLAGVASILLLYQPAWMWLVAAAVIAICYMTISKFAPKNLPLALIIAALAPLSYTGYIFYLLATVDASRPAEWPTYAAIAGYYGAGAAALAITAWLNRKHP